MDLSLSASIQLSAMAAADPSHHDAVGQRCAGVKSSNATQMPVAVVRDANALIYPVAAEH